MVIGAKYSLNSFSNYLIADNVVSQNRSNENKTRDYGVGSESRLSKKDQDSCMSQFTKLLDLKRVSISDLTSIDNFKSMINSQTNRILNILNIASKLGPKYLTKQVLNYYTALKTKSLIDIDSALLNLKNIHSSHISNNCKELSENYKASLEKWLKDKKELVERLPDASNSKVVAEWSLKNKSLLKSTGLFPKIIPSKATNSSQALSSHKQSSFPTQSDALNALEKVGGIATGVGGAALAIGAFVLSGGNWKLQ